MFAKKLIPVLCIIAISLAHGAAHGPFDKINAVVGSAHDPRGRAITLVKLIAPNTYSIVFMHSEHPKLIENDILESIASRYIRNKAPQSVHDMNDTIREEFALSDSLENTVGIFLKGHRDGKFYRFLCTLLSITLTKKWIHSFQSYFRSDAQPYYIASNRIYDVGTVKSGVKHHICTPGDIDELDISQYHIEGADASAKAATLQSKNPKCRFLFVIDNTAWREMCTEHEALVSSEHEADLVTYIEH